MCSSPSPLAHSVLLVLQDFGVPSDITEQVVLLIEADHRQRLVAARQLVSLADTDAAEKQLRLNEMTAERDQLREELDTLKQRCGPLRKPVARRWWHLF